jgi:prepilin-type N-terminal cleavage/methylation domain-containing protein
MSWVTGTQLGNRFPTGRPARRTPADLARGTLLATKRSGHSLLELLIAIAIVAIFASIGWTTIQPQVDRFRMMKAARLLHSDLQHLRALAITTNRETRLKLTGADADLDPADVQVGEWLLQVGNRDQGSTEWDTLPIDDPGGVANNGEGERSLSVGGLNETPRTSLAPWPALEGPGAGNADAVVFSPRGWLANPPTDFAGGYIALEIVAKRSGERVSVRVSRGGLSRLESGDAFALPAGSVGTAEASTP